MKILCFEIKYIGFSMSRKLSPKNKRLILNARQEGLRQPYADGTPNRLLMVKFVKNFTGASLREAYKFCKKYTY